MSTISSFKSIRIKHDVGRVKYFMKNFCESLREHAMRIINFKNKKMKLLTNEQEKSYQNPKICYICKGKFEDKHAKDMNYCKVRDHCYYIGEYRGAIHSICNLKYNIPKEIPIIPIIYLKKFLFHNGSNYDYHLIIKESVEEFEKQSACLGENTENT